MIGIDFPYQQFFPKHATIIQIENAIFTCDVETPTIWAPRYLRMNSKRRLLGSFAPSRRDGLKLREFFQPAAGW
jgi:hypothetical protein